MVADDEKQLLYRRLDVMADQINAVVHSMISAGFQPADARAGTIARLSGAIGLDLDDNDTLVLVLFIFERMKAGTP